MPQYIKTGKTNIFGQTNTIKISCSLTFIYFESMRYSCSISQSSRAQRACAKRWSLSRKTSFLFRIVYAKHSVYPTITCLSQNRKKKERLSRWQTCRIAYLLAGFRRRAGHGSRDSHPDLVKNSRLHPTPSPSSMTR